MTRWSVRVSVHLDVLGKKMLEFMSGLKPYSSVDLVIVKSPVSIRLFFLYDLGERASYLLGETNLG